MTKIFRSFLPLALLLAGILTALPGAAESFLVISDTHITENGRDQAAVWDAVIKAAKGKDAVLLLGDNTNNSHPEEHDLVLAWVRRIREDTGAAVYLIPGNHDYTRPFGPRGFLNLYGAYGPQSAFSRDGATAGHAVMTEKGTCLIMLDTNLHDPSGSLPADGGIGGRTLTWIREVLSSLPDGTPVLVCGHHPILPRARDARTPGAAALSNLLREYGAGLYLCGHDHGFGTVEAEGLRQITVGQPHMYPGCAGILERDGGAFTWRTQRLFSEGSVTFLGMRKDALSLGRQMALGALASTPYAHDEGAIEWYVSAYMLFAGGEMTKDESQRLLNDENCEKWRSSETRTVVKSWIMGLLENVPDDVRQVYVPSSVKHAAAEDFFR